MSDQTQSNNSQTIVIALVVVAVLLAALVGVLIYQQSKAASIASVTPPAATGTDPAAQAPPGMGGTTGEAAPFDEKTATKVPAGTSPEDFLKTYHEDVVAGKYDEAYKMLPIDKQQSYGDAASYGSQVKGYGITGYKLGKATTDGDQTTIVALMENPAMPITYTWTFKKVGDQLFVVSRTMGGAIE